MQTERTKEVWRFPFDSIFKVNESQKYFANFKSLEAFSAKVRRFAIWGGGREKGGFKSSKTFIGGG